MKFGEKLKRARAVEGRRLILAAVLMLVDIIFCVWDGFSSRAAWVSLGVSVLFLILLITLANYLLEEVACDELLVREACVTQDSLDQALSRLAIDVKKASDLSIKAQGEYDEKWREDPAQYSYAALVRNEAFRKIHGTFFWIHDAAKRLGFQVRGSFKEYLMSPTSHDVSDGKTASRRSMNRGAPID